MMEGEFPLPSETEEEDLRESFLYMTLRSILIRMGIEQGLEWDEIQAFIKLQDELWEGLGGTVPDG